MFRNYLKIAFRNLKKQKLHSFINIAGLTIGMAVSILILSYVWFELSFDKFHSKSDQIYRVVQSRRLIEKETNWGRTSPGLYMALKEEFPEILHCARLYYLKFKAELSYNDKTFVEEPGGIVLVDPEIFNIFDIKLMIGDPKTALQDPNSIILTEAEARKYFGDESPIGRYINIHEAGEEEELNLKVTGVAKAMPANSHFSFKFLIPYKRVHPRSNFFITIFGCTYITLPPEYPPENLEKKLPELVRKYIAPEIEGWVSTSYEEWMKAGGYWNLKLQPLKAIHLDNYYVHNTLPVIKKGNKFQVNTYTVTALFLIVLACINFITLSTARSGIRAKEVGVRKVAGATRKQLIKQFLTESIMLSFIALLFAVLLVVIFSKTFTKLLEIQTSHNLADIVFLGSSFLVVTLVIGVIAGSYPAFFLSAFRPVSVLKGQLLEKMKGRVIRNGLVIIQFIISILLMISSAVVFKQYVYMQNKNLGFDKENIIIIRNLRNLWRQGDETVPREERELRNTTFLQEILKHPNVINASLMRNKPGIWDGYGAIPLRPEGAIAGTKLSIFSTSIDHAYLDVFGLNLAAGRNFKKSITIPRKREGVIINEKAASRMGLEKPVGKYIYIKEWVSVTNDGGKKERVQKEVQVPIIGVFKDYHNRNLYREISATIFFPLYQGNYYASAIAVKFIPGNVSRNITFLEKTWNTFVSYRPLEYSFFDQEFETLYNKEKKLANIFTFFTILSIFIACLGIFGLAAFTVEQRTKEIGIRKVMGASIANIVEILSKIYLKLIIVAVLLACPLGYITMGRWLQNFPYHMEIGAVVFIFTVVITLIIVISSVSYHSIKAALTNPARTLKYE